jgi:hypothetical protein
MQNNNSIIDEVTPIKFFLSQNYPNPFSEKTVIKYCVAYKTRVQIAVYNTEGEEIEKLVDEEKNPGTYEVEFDASTCHSSSDQSFRLVSAGRSPDGLVRNLESGNYYYCLEACNYKSEKIMTLIK